MRKGGKQNQLAVGFQAPGKPYWWIFQGIYENDYWQVGKPEKKLFREGKMQTVLAVPCGC
jgi:hypothetical protein